MCWVGRLEARKELPIILDAVESLPQDLDFELLIIGDGGKDALGTRLENFSDSRKGLPCYPA